MKKINRRVRLAIRKPKVIITRRVKKFRNQMDQIIEKHGYMVQAVTAGPGSFAYTIGRMRSNTPEIILVGANRHTVGLIAEVIERLKAGEITMYQPFQSRTLVSSLTNDPTNVMVIHASVHDVLEKMLGMRRELRTLKRDQCAANPPLKILVAEKDNKFAPNLRNAEGLAQAWARGEIFKAYWGDYVERLAK